MTARDHSASAGSVEAGFERVARVSDLREGGVLGVTGSSGRAICLFRQGGRIGAVKDQCTHQAFPMSEGTLQPDGTIECSWHGARFDCATGDVVEGPAQDRIAIYETRVIGEEIWVGPPR